MAAVGSSGGQKQGYRNRRPLRALLLVVILSGVAGLVWFNVLHQTETGCAGPEPTAVVNISGQRLPANGLDAVSPAPPQFTRVRVLNANGRLGEATIVDGALAHLGFASTTTPANDPLHPDLDLRCYGEIRFGAAGQAAARTLSLAVPCAELVRDVRPDSDVDLAAGYQIQPFDPTTRPAPPCWTRPASASSVQVVPPHGGLAAQAGPPDTASIQPAVPVVDPSLLRRARQVTC